MNDLRNNKKIQFLAIQFSFILISLIFVSGIIYTNRIVSSSDSIFNYQRIYEAFMQLVHFHIPQFSLNTFLPLGSGVMSFYPWLIFAPVAPLVLIIHSPILLWSTIISIFMMIGLEVSYYSCLSFQHNKRISYLFSIFYCFSTIEILLAIADSDIGEYVGILFAPLVFFGWLHWIKNNKWKMVVVGLCLIAFSHVITFIIILFSLILITIVFINQIDWTKKKIFSGILVLLVTMLISSIVWIPICELMAHNNITPPSTNLLAVNNVATVIPNRLSFLMIPWLYKVWTFSDLASIILVIVYWKKLNGFNKKLFLIAIFYIILNMNPIKDLLILHTPLIKMQFMYRICFFSHMLLSFLLALIIIKILIPRWYIQNVWTIILLLIVLMIGSIYLSGAVINIMPSHSKVNFSYINHIKSSTKKENTYKQDLIVKTVLSNKIMRHKRFYQFTSNFDYLPLPKSHKYLTSSAILHNGSVRLPVSNKRTGTIYFFSKKRYKHLIVPIMLYNHQNYSIKVNNHNNEYSFNKKYMCLEMKKTKNGINKVKIRPKIMPYRYVSAVLMIIGIMMLIFIDNRKEF